MIHSRMMLMVYGRVVPLPRERDGVIIDQYLASSQGPIYQSAGSSKWLVQVTKELLPFGNNWKEKLSTLLTVTLPDVAGVFTSERKDEPIYWIQAWAAAFAVHIAAWVVSAQIVLPIGAFLWGVPLQTLQDVGLSEKDKPAKELEKEPEVAACHPGSGKEDGGSQQV